MQQTDASGERRAGRVPRGARNAMTAVALAAAIGLALVGIGVGDDSDRASVARPLTPPAVNAVPVSVRVDLRHPGHVVPRRFLGLSFEASSLPQVGSFGASGNFVGLLRSLGTGMLRFGGVSADTRIAWTDANTPRPAWTSNALGAGDLRRLGALASRSGWRVLLTVGLAHYQPAAAAREVAAARRALGPWLAGVEVGNEPDAYARHGLRGASWSPAGYDAELRRYRRAIAKLARGVPLAAPGVSGSHSFLSWGSAVARAQRPALLTGHHYPLGCHQEPPPSIATLLSGRTRRLAATSLARYMAVSRRARIPLRIDEANSVSCGGRAGVSNTFASALWAVDYISQAMTAGAAGINLQGNPANCAGYSPVCGTSSRRLARGVLTALPVWYSLLLTKPLVGDRPVRTRVSSPQRPNIAVRALLARGGKMHVVVVEEDPPGSPPAAVSVRVGRRFAAASVLSLTAPSLESTTGVTLGGWPVRADGSWRPSPRLPSVPAMGGAVTVTVPAGSAALLTLTPGR